MTKYQITRSGMPTFALFQLFFDLATIIISAELSKYFLKKELVDMHQGSISIVMIAYLLVALTRDLYHSMFAIPLKTALFLHLKVWIISFCATAFINYMLFENAASFLLLWFILGAICLLLFNSLHKWLSNYFFSKRIANIAFVGRSTYGQILVKSLKKIAPITFNNIGFFDDKVNKTIAGIEKVGDLEQLGLIAKAGLVDQIYVTESMRDNQAIEPFIKKLSDTTCSVMVLPDIFSFNLLASQFYNIDNIPLISIYDTPFKGVNRLVKRIEDFVLAFFIILAISPILVCIAIAIKVSSKGPVIFKQARYGVNGRKITVWKFRSMKVADEVIEVKQAIKNDPRLTLIGGFLRRTSLDELPQFFNVLKGNMSIVGPRPHAVMHNEEYRLLISGYMQRHKVKPGITGWAQVNGYRGETEKLEKMERRIKYDLEYIRNWSVSLDLKIIFFTILKGFINKAAY